MTTRRRTTRAQGTKRMSSSTRVFDFTEADFSVPIPDNLPPPTRSNQLPFREWFGNCAAAAEAGKQPHLFVPHAYWVLDRGVEAEKVTDGYARTKLREQFKAFSEKDRKKTDAALGITILGRTGKEGIEGITEPGISVWLTKAA